MQNYLKKYLSSVFLFSSLILISSSFNHYLANYQLNLTAAAFNPSSLAENDYKVASGFAWNDNVGWINFGTSTERVAGRVYVSNTDLRGYAWGENIGWISFNCLNDDSCNNSNYAVANNGTGGLSGYAWGENIGWINFDGVNIDRVTGTFSGWAWGENIGWISFNDSGDFGVTTAWNNPASSGGGGVTYQTCTFTYSDWSACTNNQQTRTVTSDFTNCSNSHEEPLSRICPTATTTQIGISIKPVTSTILAGGTIEFTAIITGTTTNNKATWAVLPVDLDNFYGTINESGVYTAPINITGVRNAIIRATAQADITKSATAEVVIRLAVATTTATSTTATSSATTTITETKSTTTEKTLDNSDIIVTTDSDHGASNSNLKNAPENVLTDNLAVVLGTTTEKVLAEAKKIVESKTGKVVTKTFSAAGVVGGGLAASSAIVLNPSLVLDLLFLPLRLWGLLLSALGLKKRHQPWGTIYDSVTKQPIDPAYVTLKKVDDKEENTSITDLDGRYGFLVNPGQYILQANKTNYLFPSQKLAGKNNDELYSNLYFGNEIKVEGMGTLIQKNIPLDPIKFDWNEFVKNKKKLTKFYSRREKVVRIITDWIFRIGFVVSVVSLVLVVAPYNAIIFGFYLILALLRKFGLKQKPFGFLTEKDGRPLSFAIVRIMAADLNVEITNKVADQIGRYYCLVPKGKYYVKIEKKKDDGSYVTAYTSPAFDAPNGIINKNFIS